MQEEEQYSEDLRDIDVADLPQEFTSKIINIIKDKQNDGNNTSVADEEYNPSEEESDQYEPPIKNTKNSCKKSGKKVDRNTLRVQQQRNRNVNFKTSNRFSQYKGGKRDVAAIDDTEEGQQESQNERGEKKDKANNQNNGSILETQQVLKEYFKDYLTAVLQKMQQITNKKLKEISNKVNYLESRMESLGSRKKESEMEYTGEDKQKRHPYIKSWLKLEYIERIERGELSTKEAARQLKLKEATILSWMGNKDKFKPNSRYKKSDRDEIDSECLNIE